MFMQRLFDSIARRLAPSRRVGVAALLVCGACSSDELPGAFQARDSAGVHIVFSAAPLTGENGWRIATIPVVDIGGADADRTVSFADIVGALLLPGGEFVVADGSDQALRFFDERGAHIRDVGRKGGGPGEYEQIYRIRHAGDSIVVLDTELERITMLDHRGEYGRSFTLTGAVTGSRIEGRWIDGRFLFVEGSGVSSNMPIHMLRDTLTVLRVAGDGSPDSVLGSWPGSEKMAVTSPQFVSSIELPYGKRSTIRVGGDGFLVGTAAAAQIDCYDSNGALRSSIRWAANPDAVSSNEIDAWREMYRTRMVGAPPSFAAAFGSATDIARFPSTRPAYRTFVVTPDGELWVARVPAWDADDDATEWDVFDANGRWLSAVRVPGGAELLDVRRDRLLTSWEDEDGVPHIRVYTLNRTPP